MLVLIVLAQVGEAKDLLTAKDITIGGVVLAVLLIIGVGAVRGWWYPGGVYDDQKKRADRMEERAFKATDGMEVAVGAADKLSRQNEDLTRQNAELVRQNSWLQGQLDQLRDRTV
jgi:hypothetical protein